MMGNLQVVENHVQYIHIISRRLSIGIDELERLEVPVEYDNQRVFVGVAVEVAGCRRE